jgi:glycosyltransferase involved in cell wall biosynthesis
VKILPTVDVSVVIPTLGGESLYETIDSLNNGSVAPAEILVCIPAGYAYKATELPSNVKVLICPIKGQVAQRRYGFINAVSNYVMQLDDDIHLGIDCLKKLLEIISNCDDNVAISPLLFNKKNKTIAYTSHKKLSLKNRIYYWLVNGSIGYQPGAVMLSGFALGPVVEYVGGSNANCISVNWLPGGCVMHRKNNLVLDDYYPFQGKAYCEDIIHSYLMKKKTIKLLIDPAAQCETEIFSILDEDFKSFYQNLKRDFRARRYAMSIEARLNWRLYLNYLFLVASYFLKRIKMRAY